MRRHTSEMKFRFLGDTDAAKTLIPLARKLMGGLLESAKHNDLKVLCRHWTINDILMPKDDSQKKTKGKAGKKQADHDKKGRQDRFDAVPEGVEYPDNSTIDVYWYANICLAVINVPRVREKREGGELLIDSVKGFIVNVTMTTQYRENDNIFCVAHVIEPGYESDSPNYYLNNYNDTSDDARWVYPWGGSFYEWKYIPDDKLGSISYGSTEYSDAEISAAIRWTGFNDNGFAKRELKTIGLEYLCDLSLSEYTEDIQMNPPVDPTKIIQLAPGAEAAGITQFDTGHIRDLPEWRAYFMDVGSPSAEVWNANATFINDTMKGPRYSRDGSSYWRGDGWQRYLNCNENYLLAARELLLQVGGNHFHYPTQRFGDQDWYGSDYGFTNYPYSSVALLPEGSVISDDGPYNPFADPALSEPWYYYTYEGYDSLFPDRPSLFSHYHNQAEKIVRENILPYKLFPFDGAPSGSPPTNGLITQETLFPNAYLQPGTYYLDRQASSHFIFDTDKSTGTINAKAKPGFYTVKIPSWFNGKEITGVEFTADITLIGSGFIGKTSINGVTGVKNDTIKILVNTAIEFEEGNAGDLFGKLLIVK